MFRYVHPLAGALGLAVVWAALAAAPARADHIDAKLPVETSKILRHLQAEGLQTVGVLRFRVKKGGEERFDLCPMNNNLATRLQNRLVSMNSDEKPLNILRDPGKVIAAQHQHLNYLKPEGRARLFDLTYSLVWDDSKPYKADAFLTGKVELSPDKKMTIVSFEIIDRKTKSLKPLQKLEVKTDRQILTDLCEGFVLNGRRLRTMSPDDQEEMAAQDSLTLDGGAPDKPAAKDPPEKPRGGDQPKDPDTTTKESTPVDPKPEVKDAAKEAVRERLVDLEILYNGQPQEIKLHADPNKAGEWQVAEPQAGDKVTLRLKSLADDRIGVVLAFNGRNTLYGENVDEVSPIGCKKWILDKGDSYDIAGITPAGDDTKVLPFRVLTREESLAKEELDPSAKLGAIQLFVFLQGQEDQGQVKLSTQGLGRRSLLSPRDRPRTAAQAKDLARKNTQTMTQGLLDVDEKAATPQSLQTASFKYPLFQESRIIWYYERQKR